MITKQDELWPWCRNFQTGETDNQFKERIKKERYDIKNDLLYECITYGEGLTKRQFPLHRSSGGFMKGKGIGYVLLVFFARRVFQDIYRYPMCEDRNFSKLSNKDKMLALKILSSLSKPQIDSILAELTELYNHTQRNILDQNITNITLARRIKNSDDNKYAECMIRRIEIASSEKKDVIDVEMDTLNSYGDDGGYPHFPMKITQTIHPKTIFYCSNLIRNRANDNDKAVESGEWVVINDSPTGIIQLPISSFQYDCENFESLRNRCSKNPTSIIRGYRDCEPIYLSESAFIRPEYPCLGKVGKVPMKIRLKALWNAFKRGY
ncbi:MAG: hypothetical protein D084_Lepto4C00513G0009 [Leptospirillum sp. Group IV 'UBA BS']|nr:MAG: hypothetical protein D084_Lepto4C00513G0009 [Leptospirillum sp. Group IV 'UBA BS']